MLQKKKKERKIRGRRLSPGFENMRVSRDPSQSSFGKSAAQLPMHVNWKVIAETTSCLEINSRDIKSFNVKIKSFRKNKEEYLMLVW